MNRRLLLAAVALALLAASAGCLGFFGEQDVDDDRLNEEPPAPYEWDSDAAVHITVTENANFQGVYEVEGDDDVRLYRRDGFGGENSIPVRAVRYRYPNGTVISGGEFSERGGDVSKTRDAVIVRLPEDAPDDETGKLAFTSDSTPKRFSLPVYDFAEGSYEVVLPPDRRVDFPVFGSVSPRSATTAIDDQSRVHVRWTGDDVEGSRSIVVQFYLQRDLYIFGGIAGTLAVVTVLGLLYYRRQIESLKEQREELGLDVDTDDDEFDDGPPPGMG